MLRKAADNAFGLPREQLVALRAEVLINDLFLLICVSYHLNLLHQGQIRAL
jgi:hypothetical protein